MHSRCCWPPESAPPGVAEPVLHLVPQARRAAGTSPRRSSRSCRATVDAAELEARQHVLGDDHRRERVRLLEHHADTAADVGDEESGRGRCRSPSSATVPGERRARHELVHPVQDAQERRLAAARRSDQRGDLFGGMSRVTRSSTLCSPNHALTCRARASVAGAAGRARAGSTSSVSVRGRAHARPFRASRAA